MEHQAKTWEKEFDKFWGYDMCKQNNFDEIKSFISSLIESERKETQEEILRNLLDYKPELMSDIENYKLMTAQNA